MNADFENEVKCGSTRTDIFSEIVAIHADEDLTLIDATGQFHTLSNPSLDFSELKHSPTFRQVNGAIKGLRLTRGENTFGATFFTWTGHRVCFLDDQQVVKTIDLENSGAECPEIDCAAFCPQRGLLVIGDNYRTLRLITSEMWLILGSLTLKMILKYGLRILRMIMM